MVAEIVFWKMKIFVLFVWIKRPPGRIPISVLLRWISVKQKNNLQGFLSNESVKEVWEVIRDPLLQILYDTLPQMVPTLLHLHLFFAVFLTSVCRACLRHHSPWSRFGCWRAPWRARRCGLWTCSRSAQSAVSFWERKLRIIVFRDLAKFLFPLKRKSGPKKGEFQNDCQQILESEIFKYILEKRKRGRLKAKYPFVEFHKVEYNRDQASSPEVDVCKEGGESSARFRCWLCLFLLRGAHNLFCYK